MVSRLWHPSTGAAPISPAFDASWTTTTGAVRGQLSGVPTGSSMNAASAARVAFAPAQVWLVRQDVSLPLPGAKTISGSVTVAIPHRYSGDVSGVNATPRVIVKVVTAAGALRGTLLVATGTPSSGYANFKPAMVTGVMTPVNALAGDYVVVEKGWTFPTAPGSGTTASMFIGDAFGVPDAVVGDVSSSFSFRPWTEFTQDDIWGPVPRRVAGLATEVADRSTSPSRRVAGAAVEVLDRASYAPARVAGLAVEVVRGRAGQTLRRRIRSMGGVEPLVKVPGLGWRAVRPVPLPVEVPVSPPPLYLGHGLSVTSFPNVTTAFTLKAGDRLVLNYTAGRATPRNITGPPTAIAGVVWSLLWKSADYVGGGPRHAAYVGVVSGDVTIATGSTIGVPLDGSDTACATMLSGWRNIAGVLVAVGSLDGVASPAVLTAAASLNRHRIAVGGFGAGVSGTIAPTNPTTAWWGDSGGTAKYFAVVDPFGASAGDVAGLITSGGGSIGGQMMVLS